jgi:2'-5' RNA ligase
LVASSLKQNTQNYPLARASFFSENHPLPSSSYSIEMHFDAKSGQAIRELRQALYRSLQLEDREEPLTSPHLSLGVYSRLSVEREKADLSAFARSTAPFSVQFSSIGIFSAESDVVYLGPIVTTELLELHSGFHSLFQHAEKRCSPYYRVGRWVPHCTLATNVPKHKTPLALANLLELKLPLKVRVKSVALIEYPPVKTLYSFRFSGKRGKAF